MIKKSKFLQNAKQELVNTNFKQLEPKKCNDFFKDKLLHQNLELREAHQRSLTEIGRIKEVSECCIRHCGKTKIHRGSEHCIGTFWPNTGIAK